MLCSCARAPVRTSICPAPGIQPVPISLPQARADTFHTVGPGETIWRIAKMYDVSMASVAAANNIKDTSKLEMGQRLRIPAAAPIKPVVALFQTDKWKYIVVHHSATDEGNALAFYQSHRKRGWDSIGYHFVIDNGSEGKQDGQIEVSPRWVKQQDGAHCKASGMNSKGIGICLVGNFNNEYVSQKQLDSLVYLITTMRRYYDIPNRNILGHKQVPGAQTECPGKNFPWKELNRRIN